jgi:hypothetical protein
MSDLIQRAAAICGIDNPNSDQLAAWLDEHLVTVTINSFPTEPREWWACLSRLGDGGIIELAEQTTLLEALAAAVVEVDRIEREARNAN